MEVIIVLVLLWVFLAPIVLFFVGLGVGLARSRKRLEQASDLEFRERRSSMRQAWNEGYCAAEEQYKRQADVFSSSVARSPEELREHQLIQLHGRKEDSSFSSAYSSNAHPSVNDGFWTPASGPASAQPTEAFVHSESVETNQDQPLSFGAAAQPQRATEAPENQRQIRRESPKYSSAQERELAREYRNVTITLYSAALLILAAAAIFLTASVDGAFKVIALALVVPFFYLGGLFVRRRWPQLRIVAVSFVGVGLAVLPFVGVAFYYWLLPAPWAVTLSVSLLGVVLYAHAAIVLNSQVLSYLTLVFSLSSALSSGWLLQRGALGSLLALVVLTTIIKSIQAVGRPRLPQVLRRGWGHTNPWLNPSICVAVVFSSLSGTLEGVQAPLVITVVLLSSSVSFAIYSIKGGVRKRDVWIELSLLRVLALTLPFIWAWGLDAGWSATAAIAAIAFSFQAALLVFEPLSLRLSPWWGKTERSLEPLIFQGLAWLVFMGVLPAQKPVEWTALLVVSSVSSFALWRKRAQGKLAVPEYMLLMAMQLLIVWVKGGRMISSQMDLAQWGQWLLLLAIGLAGYAALLRFRRTPYDLYMCFAGAFIPSIFLLIGALQGWGALGEQSSRALVSTILLLVGIFASLLAFFLSRSLRSSLGEKVWWIFLVWQGFFLLITLLSAASVVEEAAAMVGLLLLGATLVFKRTREVLFDLVSIALGAFFVLDLSWGDLLVRFSAVGVFSVAAFCLHHFRGSDQRQSMRSDRVMAYTGSLSASLLLARYGVEHSADSLWSLPLVLAAICMCVRVLQVWIPGKAASKTTTPIATRVSTGLRAEWLLLVSLAVAGFFIWPAWKTGSFSPEACTLLLLIIGCVAIAARKGMESAAFGLPLLGLLLSFHCMRALKEYDLIDLQRGILALVLSAFLAFLFSFIPRTSVNEAEAEIREGKRVLLHQRLLRQLVQGFGFLMLLGAFFPLLPLRHDALQLFYPSGVLALVTLICAFVPTSKVRGFFGGSAYLASALFLVCIFGLLSDQLLMSSLAIIVGTVLWVVRLMRDKVADLWWLPPLGALLAALLVWVDMDPQWGSWSTRYMVITLVAAIISVPALLLAGVSRLRIKVISSVFCGSGGLTGLGGGFFEYSLGLLLILVASSLFSSSERSARLALWCVRGSLVTLFAERCFREMTGSFQPVWTLLVAGAGALVVGVLVDRRPRGEAERQSSDVRDVQVQEATGAGISLELCAYLGAALLWTIAGLAGMDRSITEKSAVLAAYVLLIVLGVIRKFVLVTLWGALALLVSVLIFVTDFAMGLVVALAVALIAVAVWRLKKIDAPSGPAHHVSEVQRKEDQSLAGERTSGTRD